ASFLRTSIEEGRTFSTRPPENSLCGGDCSARSSSPSKLRNSAAKTYCQGEQGRMCRTRASDVAGILGQFFVQGSSDVLTGVSRRTREVLQKYGGTNQKYPHRKNERNPHNYSNAKQEHRSHDVAE